MANNNKGFSLIELMIVVAIIGILSAIAIPNFQKFQAKSRQSEAKANLAALYTAQKAFSAEWNMYFGDFRDLGFAPEGTLRYNISNGGGGPALPSDYTHVGAACTATPCDAFTASTEWNTIAYCVGGGAGACTPSAQFAENATVIPGSVAPTATAFVAAAGGNIDNDATFDRWTMNQNKVLINTQDDVMTP